MSLVKFDHLSGNIPKLYHSEGWNFHREILERCEYQFISLLFLLTEIHLDGSTMRIKGALGVRGYYLPGGPT
jgi:hypothetical protein